MPASHGVPRGPGIPNSQSMRFKVPSDFLVGRAKNPNGWSLRQHFLSSLKRAWAMPLILRYHHTFTVYARLQGQFFFSLCLRVFTVIVESNKDMIPRFQAVEILYFLLILPFTFEVKIKFRWLYLITFLEIGNLNGSLNLYTNEPLPWIWKTRQVGWLQSDPLSHSQ